MSEPYPAPSPDNFEQFFDAPSLEDQRELLTLVHNQQAERMIMSGLAGKARTAYDKHIRAIADPASILRTVPGVLKAPSGGEASRYSDRLLDPRDYRVHYEYNEKHGVEYYSIDIENRSVLVSILTMRGGSVPITPSEL